MKRIGFLAGVIGLMLTAMVMTGSNTYIETGETQQELAEKVLRFHVRANSNSREDQSLKLKVRDAIGEQLSVQLKGVTDMEECRRVVTENMRTIVKTAERVIGQEGYHYPVESKLANVEFPEKTYGVYTFPAGSYEALEVIIGSGMGQNWWCVMYPNMCFAGSTYEVIEEDAKQSLQKTLTPSEYESIMEKKNYKIRFRYLKFLNGFL